MKRLLLAAAAVLTLAAPTAALADHDRRGGYDDDRYYSERAYGDRYERYDRRYDDRGRYERGWRRGDYLPYGLRRGHWVEPRAYGLHRPRDRNLGWFRVGDQLILANLHNGLIAEAHWR